MKDYDIFTMDPERYPPAKTLLFTKEQQAKGRMVIPIIDPGVSSRRGFAPYDTGLESNVFLRSADGSSLYADYAWPKVHVHFPDFFHQSTSDYWHSLLAEFKQKLIPFDGLWLDMCEPASLQPAEKPIPPHPGHKKYDLNYPPFAINNGNEERDIFRNTINMDVLHVDGKTRHITLHNAYGAAIARRTAEALELMEPGKRHFILTRSTFPGSGRFTAHWLGDNYSDFENMRLSIAGMMDFQLFGIPMVGADICGFHGTSNPELCARWMALGSFYPFARNHNSERVENTPQEPYRWPIVTEVTRKYFALRYSLLPYWITLLRNAHDSGRPVIRPLFFEFPGLLDIYRDIDEIFMLGSVLLVVPVLTQIDTVEFMIPPGIWYDFLDEKSLPITKHHPEKITLRANLLTLPVLLRGGYALFRQEPKLTIQDTLLSPYELLVALGRDGKAIGTSYFDDGESANPESHQTTTVEIEAETRGNQIIVSFQGHYGYRIIPRLERIVILSAEPCFCSIIGINMEQLQQSWDPIRNAQARANRLTLVGLSIDLNQPLHLSITLEHHQPEDTQLPTLETLTINSSTGSQCLPKHDHSY